MRFSSFHPPATGVQGSAPSITLGGLGYTGDLNATNGATVGTNLRLVGGTVIATDAAILNSAVTIDSGTGIISGIGTSGVPVRNANIGVNTSTGVITGIGTGDGQVVRNANIGVNTSTGVISGIGTGDGTVVRNANIGVNTSTGVISGIGTGDGTVVRNANIGVDTSTGVISGIGAGDGTVVRNANILINAGTGVISGIGTGTGTAVSNSRITLSAAGVLTGGGTSAQIDLGSLQGAVGTSQIAADAITATQIATGAVTSSELASGAVTTAKIAADAITSNEIAVGAVTSSELASGAVTTAKIAADAITSNEIAVGAVTSSELASGAVTTAKIAADAITSNEIAVGAVTSSELASGAVTTAKIAADAITAAEIAPGAITSAELASNSVTSGKIPVGSLIKLGEGSSTVILDGNASSSKRISVGNALPDAAPFSVTNTGKLKATDWELFDADGSLMLSKEGPTENFRLAILGRGANAPSQASYTTSIKGVGSTAGATTSVNTATIRVGDDSVVDIDLEWDLSTALGTTYASFPSTVVFDVYRRFSTDNTTWGSWTSQGTQTFTKAGSGASTTTYVVLETTLSSYPGEPTVTSAIVASVIKPKMTISNATMAAGYYQFCVVDSGAFPTGPMSACPIVMTFVDDDLTPSFIISDLPVGPVPFVNPTSGFKNLVIVSGPYNLDTSTDVIKVTADWIILSTPEGLTRTIPNFDYSLDLDNTIGVGSSAATLPLSDSWMYIWAVSNGKLDNTGDGIVLSNSASSAVITTHRYKCLVGAAYYLAGTGGVRSFIQLGNEVEYTDVAGAEIISGSSGSTTTPTWTTTDSGVMAIAVPPLTICREIKLHVSKRGGTIIVAPDGSYGSQTGSSSNTAPPIVLTGSDTAITTTLIRRYTTIAYAASDSNARVTARGFSLLI